MKKILYLTLSALLLLNLMPVSSNAAALPTGVQKVTLIQGSTERYYLLYVPKIAQGRTGNSVLLVLHGGGGAAIKMAEIEDLRQQADAQGFILAYPNGIDGYWNDGHATGTAAQVDDVGFIRAVVADLVKKQGLSTSKVFMTGMSSGGYMSARVACEATDLVAGIAEVSSLLFTNYTCKPSKPIPVMMFNGTDDKLALFNGGVPKVSGNGDGGGAQSFTTVRDFWMKQSKCSTKLSTQTIDKLDDYTSVEVQNATCLKGIRQRFFVINGGGHNWPGGDSTSTSPFTKYVTQEISASVEIAKFFKTFGLY